MHEEKTGKKAVIYCRVSTKEQAEDGNSLVTQERICMEYALRHEYNISAVYIEQGESAKTADRTELQNLLRFCADRKHHISAVIVYKLDRFSRNIDDYSQLRILLKKYGVEIKSTSEHFEDNPAGRFMENIIANVAQFDNDVRAERCVGGMKEAVKEGRYVWMAPLGYSNVKVGDKSTIAPNAWAKDIKTIFKKVSENRYSLEDIRKQVSIYNANKKAKKYISKSYFYKLIRNEVYAGWINKFGERHKGNFEAIVSEDLFTVVQNVINNKKSHRIQRVSDHPDFTLRRFISHTSGKALTGGWSKGSRQKYPYYKVHGTGINISKKILEEVFKGWLNQFQLGIERFDQVNQYLKNTIINKLTNTGLIKEKLQKDIDDLIEKQKIIIDKNIDGIISDEVCKERLLELNSNLASLKLQLADVSDTGINKQVFLDIVRKILLSPGDLWEEAEPEDKIRLQWFYFPNGIKVDQYGSRTPKICSLFKLKEVIGDANSSKVTHRNGKLNITKLQVTLPPEKQPDITSMDFWHQVTEELKPLIPVKGKCVKGNFLSLKKETHRA